MNTQAMSILKMFDIPLIRGEGILGQKVRRWERLNLMNVLKKLSVAREEHFGSFISWTIWFFRDGSGVLLDSHNVVEPV